MKTNIEVTIGRRRNFIWKLIYCCVTSDIALIMLSTSYNSVLRRPLCISKPYCPIDVDRDK